MKRLMVAIVATVLCGALALPASAQQGPPAGNDGTNGGRPDRGGRGRGGGGFDEQGGRGGMRGGGPPGIEIAKYEALRNYIDVVDRYARLAQDPTSAGVAAVISASDVLRQQGPNAAIDYFTRIMPEVSPPVERAIRIQLADLYKVSGQPQKALEQYEFLMRGAGAHVGPMQPAMGPPGPGALGRGPQMPPGGAPQPPQPPQPQMQPPQQMPGGPVSPGGGPTPPPRPAQ